MATVTGGSGNDTLNGTANSDTITAGGGDDWIVGSAGADSINGGTGRDTVDYSTSTQAVEVDLLKGQGRGGDAEGDSYTGVDNIVGSSQGDKLTGHNFASTLDGGAGDDTLYGGTGNNDLLFGGTGNDKLFGGDGSDNLQGGDGADSLDGGAGNDTLSGGAGSDTMLGGFGNDTFILEGADSIVGGDGLDTLDASAQTAGQTYAVDSGGTVATPGTQTTAQFKEIESFRLGSGSDTFNASTAGTSLTVEGNAGDDRITTGAGNDSLSGGTGNDTLSGGTGSDTLSGGAGSDTLSGDAGDDTITTGSGADIIRVTQDAGSDVVTDFDMTMVGGQTADQIDVSNLTDAAGNPVTWHDVTVSDTNGDGSGDAILSFPGGEQITLRGVSPSQVTTWQQMTAIGIPCFSSGTPILTPIGPRPVESLVRGDLVVTEQGLAPVMWTASRHCGPDDLARDVGLVPVHFPAGAIGNDRPLRLSYQHAVRVIDARGGAALVRAGHLACIGFGGARLARGVRSVTWHHILLPRHAIVFAAGAPCESFYPGPESIAMLDWPARITLAATICAAAGVPTTGPLCELYGPRILPLLSRRALGGISVMPPSAVPPR